MTVEDGELNRAAIKALKLAKEHAPSIVGGVIILLVEEDGKLITSMTNTKLPPGELELVLAAELDRVLSGAEPTLHRVSKAGEIYREEP